MCINTSEKPSQHEIHHSLFISGIRREYFIIKSNVCYIELHRIFTSSAHKPRQLLGQAHLIREKRTDLESKIAEHFFACLKPEYMEDYIKHISVPSDSTETINNNNLKCYISCLSTNMGFYNETTGWNKDLIVENFVHTENEAQLRDSIELCIEKYGQLPGECEAAAGVHGCLDQLKKDFEVQVSSPLSTYESTAFV